VSAGSVDKRFGAAIELAPPDAAAAAPPPPHPSRGTDAAHVTLDLLERSARPRASGPTARRRATKERSGTATPRSSCGTRWSG
jgi:hypothetical protein